MNCFRGCARPSPRPRGGGERAVAVTVIPTSFPQNEMAARMFLAPPQICQAIAISPQRSSAGAGRSCCQSFHFSGTSNHSGLHAALDAVRLEDLLVFLADVGVLEPVGDRGAAFLQLHAGVVDVLLAGRAGIAAGVVRAEPGGQAERLVTDGVVPVIPARAAGRCRDEAELLVVDACARPSRCRPSRASRRRARARNRCSPCP